MSFEYRTRSHGPVPEFVTTPDGMTHHTPLLIAQGQTEYLAQIGAGYPHHISDEPAPFGLIWEEINGEYFAAPAGNDEERAAAVAAQAQAELERWRETFVIDACQGRYILATMDPITEGPLSAFPGPRLLNQIDALCLATLAPQDYVRYKDWPRWKRNDAQVEQLRTAAGMSAIDVDNWFRSAAEAA